MSVTRSLKVPLMKKEHWLLIAAAAGGALIWILISTASGKKEAWDSDLYFSIGIPAVCLLAALLGFLEPKRTWRWGAAPLAGQFLAMLLMVGPGNLLPLGIIVFAVLAIPPILVARLGAYLRNRVAH
jgi:peptidoglycan/LPS O-acetylase OafA/YrhL